ncbi:MAG TPA: gene transfer agent family protein [Henriciella marina]|uniref:GTA-gp10 family protein n=1 Tax=Henriciella sp. TaxID=1968823 RepID=UPI0017CD540A|nr:GTA-gp10 family protein [Henriciella sp.]HIG21268.1 gene transfer agent family protein [Henriciella sp.]HIK63749.1 gene transfer agent family protein [Henriciella marina]
MNRARGEVSLDVAGQKRVLCLTLGALAEIESAFGCASLADLQARMRRLSAAELLRLVSILMKGGGEHFEPAELASLDIQPAAAAAAVAEAFRAGVE